MLVRTICLALIIVFFNTKTYSQGINNLWLMGYANSYGAPFGGNTIDFNNGFPDTSSTLRTLNFSTTNANISDTLGNILFYTNGVEIADSTGNVMLNGSGLNPSIYTSQNFSDGLIISQASLIIPKPDDPDICFLFHNTIDVILDGSSEFLYLTTVDMAGAGGLGAVTNKNQIILTDKLNQGKLTAVKHANGRDWWVITHKMNSNRYYKFLVTPQGVSGPFNQDIGINMPIDNGQVSFSPDGSKYAYCYPPTGVQILDFDRCTGTFSNPIFSSLPDSVNDGGIAFSPNSERLYVSSIFELYQFDMMAANIAASRMLVAAWDTFYSPSPPFATYLYKAQLAPNGKIYLSTGNSTLHLHIIDSPDSLGLACNVIQHGLEVPTYYYNTLPNHPNYFLGAVVGSICDTVFTGLPPPIKNLSLNIYPNPNSGTFQIRYKPAPENLKLQVFNIIGEEVFFKLLPQWSQLQNIVIANISKGIYFVKLSSSTSSISTKFLVD